MKKLLVILAMVFFAQVAQAAIINVTGANYVVTKLYRERKAIGVDLVQNGPEKIRTEIRINKDAKCYRVHPGGGKDTPLTVDAFYNSLHKGSRVRVNGGRDWDGKINASDLWVQE